jgi:predicted acyl esterase
VGGIVWAEFNRTDGSLAATLTIVHPDGSSEPLETGWVRVRNRAIDPQQSLYGPGGIVIRPVHPNTQAAAQPVRSGYAERYLVEINPTAALIKAGDRLRLVLSVTDAGILPSGAQVAAMAGETMWIVHGPDYPSRLIVPLIPGLRHRSTHFGGYPRVRRVGQTMSILNRLRCARRSLGGQ